MLSNNRFLSDFFSFSICLHNASAKSGACCCFCLREEREREREGEQCFTRLDGWMRVDVILGRERDTLLHQEDAVKAGDGAVVTTTTDGEGDDVAGNSFT